MNPAPASFIKPKALYLAALLLVFSPFFLVEFYVRTQSGHQICDQNDNCFLSHYTASQLEAEGKKRAERWAELQPGDLESEEPSFWAWEDYYLTEARAHLRTANQALAAGDRYATCSELYILTTFYTSSVNVLGARPQDYPCEGPMAGFHSHAFSHLDTETQPRKMRWMGAAIGLLLAGLTVLVSRSKQT